MPVVVASGGVVAASLLNCAAVKFEGCESFLDAMLTALETGSTSVGKVGGQLEIDRDLTGKQTLEVGACFGGLVLGSMLVAKGGECEVEEDPTGDP